MKEEGYCMYSQRLLNKAVQKPEAQMNPMYSFYILACFSFCRTGSSCHLKYCQPGRMPFGPCGTRNTN